MIEVGVVGRGAIGGAIIAALEGGHIPGAYLAGVLVREVKDGYETDRLDELLARRPQLVIEAAGHEAARTFALPILRSGSDLLLFSVGVLADEVFETCVREILSEPASGRLLLSSGAIGGLDMLKSLATSGTLREVHLNSTTLPLSLIQPWMDAEQIARIRASDKALPVFSGTAREASRLFPAVANVAATVGLASLGLDRVEVTCIADPGATCKRHEIIAISDHSRATFVVENAFSPDNPRTSAITPYAALRLIQDWISPVVNGA